MIELKTYKNWKEICKAMDWNVTNGNGKLKQLKILESMCKYHKEGNKFIIDEIYNEPKKIIDNRKEGNNSVLSNDIQFSILHLLAKEESGVLILSRNKLLMLVGLINNQFYNITTNKEVYASNRELDIDVVSLTLGKAYNYVSGYLTRALGSLSSKLLIHVVKDIMYINVKDNEIIEDPETGMITELTNITRNREATNKEIQYILRVQKDVINAHGYEKIEDINFFKLNKIRKEINEQLAPKNINYFYYCYKIVGNENYVKEEYINLKNEVDKSYKKINKGIQDILLNSLNKKYILFQDRIKAIEEITKDIEKIEDNADELYNVLMSSNVDPFTKGEFDKNRAYFSDNFDKSIKTTIEDSIEHCNDNKISWSLEFRKYDENKKKKLEEEIEEFEF